MKLFLVPTPVGNLGDMTFRGVEVLKSVDLILAEDTRTSRVLLQHYGIETPLQSYHIFNEHQTVAGLVERLKAGTTIAVVTDAGTPGISDPGFWYVKPSKRASMWSAYRALQPLYRHSLTAACPATVLSSSDSFPTKKADRRPSTLSLTRNAR